MLLGLGRVTRDRAVAAWRSAGAREGAPVRRPSRRWRAVGARGTESLHDTGYAADASAEGTVARTRGREAHSACRTGRGPTAPARALRVRLEPEPFESSSDGIRAARELLGEPHGLERQLDRQGRRRGGAAAAAARLRQGRRRRGALGRDRGRPRLLPSHQAHPQPSCTASRATAAPLDDDERKVYEDALEPNAAELRGAGRRRRRRRSSTTRRPRA